MRAGGKEGMEYTLLLAIREDSASQKKLFLYRISAFDLEIAGHPHPQWNQLCVHD